MGKKYSKKYFIFTGTKTMHVLPVWWQLHKSVKFKRNPSLNSDVFLIFICLYKVIYFDSQQLNVSTASYKDISYTAP